MDGAGHDFGGWGGIRTHEALSRLPVFKTGAFNRSATHPLQGYYRMIAGGDKPRAALVLPEWRAEVI